MRLMATPAFLALMCLACSNDDAPAPQRTATGWETNVDVRLENLNEQLKRSAKNAQKKARDSLGVFGLKLTITMHGSELVDKSKSRVDVEVIISTNDEDALKIAQEILVNEIKAQHKGQRVQVLRFGERDKNGKQTVELRFVDGPFSP